MASVPLRWPHRAGVISGQATPASAAFLVSWGLLSLAWRPTTPSLKRAAGFTAALVLLGLIGTFPPFFNLLAGS